jgi:hypothetical protein
MVRQLADRRQNQKTKNNNNRISAIGITAELWSLFNLRLLLPLYHQQTAIAIT